MLESFIFCHCENNVFAHGSVPRGDPRADPKMRPVDENDHVGLETFYVHILALCVEAQALNMFRISAWGLPTVCFEGRQISL